MEERAEKEAEADRAPSRLQLIRQGARIRKMYFPVPTKSVIYSIYADYAFDNH